MGYKQLFLNRLLPIGLSLIGAYWFLDTYESHGNHLDFPKIFLPRIFWVISLLSIYSLNTPKSKRVWVYMNLMLYQKPVGGICLSLGYIVLEAFHMMVEIQKDEMFSILIGLNTVLMGHILFFATGLGLIYNYRTSINHFDNSV
jgi:hypothetical protein